MNPNTFNNIKTETTNSQTVQAERNIFLINHLIDKVNNTLTLFTRFIFTSVSEMTGWVLLLNYWGDLED